MIARRIRVSGRVQGVFFRAWTRDEARSLGVSGWVRNHPDGSVEAHAEGNDAQVAELLRRMRYGPLHAEVGDIEVSDAPPEKLEGFEARH